MNHLKPFSVAIAVILSCTPSGDSLGDEPLSDWSSPRPISTESVVQPSDSTQAIDTAAREPLFPVPELPKKSSAGEESSLRSRVTTERTDSLQPAPNQPAPNQRVRVASQQATIGESVLVEDSISAGPTVALSVPLPTNVTAETPPEQQSVFVQTRTPADQRERAKDAYLPVPKVSSTTVTGWQLGRLAQQKLARADQRLQLRAGMSARQLATESLHLMAQATDEATGTQAGSESLDQAFVAVREASDFLGRYGSVDNHVMKRLVSAHQTRILKRCDLSQTSALQAADIYYEFAREKFVSATQGWKDASGALMILAQTEPMARPDTDSNLSAAQVCYLRAAIACDPANSMAANELGHELLTLGKYDEARWALEHSYSQGPSPAALANLAELHRVTGNVELAQACAANLASARQVRPRIAQVVQLTPAQFASVSPQRGGPTQATQLRAPVASDSQGDQSKGPIVYRKTNPLSTGSRIAESFRSIFR